MADKTLDALDHRILELLVQDGRRSASEIGRLINLSPAAAKRRIDRLEGVGYIRGYTRVNDVDHLKNVIDRIRQSRRGSAKVIGTKTLIVLGTSTGPASG